jgi:hypothetical protein
MRRARHWPGFACHAERAYTAGGIPPARAPHPIGAFRRAISAARHGFRSTAKSMILWQTGGHSRIRPDTRISSRSDFLECGETVGNIRGGERRGRVKALVRPDRALISLRALHLRTVAVNSGFDLTANRPRTGTNSYLVRLSIHRIRLLPAMAALLALLVSGGFFAHAENPATHQHAEIVVSDAGHEHAAPENSDGQGPLIHCGANILMNTEGPAFAFLSPADERIPSASGQMAGKPRIPEPPPPRISSFFQS